LFALRPTARIIAPEFVRPFRMSGKNDLDEAAAMRGGSETATAFRDGEERRAAGAVGGAPAAAGLARETHGEP
jgi:hypothetical protein